MFMWMKFENKSNELGLYFIWISIVLKLLEDKLLECFHAVIEVLQFLVYLDIKYWIDRIAFIDVAVKRLEYLILVWKIASESLIATFDTSCKYTRMSNYGSQNSITIIL